MGKPDPSSFAAQHKWIDKFITWFLWFIIILLLLTPVWVVILVLTGKQTTAQKLGPNAPANQQPVIAQRNDNSKYQVLLSTSTSSAGTQTWNQVYYIMYNPSTSSDPTQTVFDTYAAAQSYYNSDVGTLKNKSYSPVSTTLLNADYTNIQSQ